MSRVMKLYYIVYKIQMWLGKGVEHIHIHLYVMHCFRLPTFMVFAAIILALPLVSPIESSNFTKGAISLILGSGLVAVHLFYRWLFGSKEYREGIVRQLNEEGFEPSRNAIIAMAMCIIVAMILPATILIVELFMKKE